jgi:hypothetical protein
VAGWDKSEFTERMLLSLGLALTINQLKHMVIQSNNAYKHKETVKNSLNVNWW